MEDGVAAEDRDTKAVENAARDIQRRRDLQNRLDLDDFLPNDSGLTLGWAWRCGSDHSASSDSS